MDFKAKALSNITLQPKGLLHKIKHFFHREEVLVC